jgi:endonuclease/exonuclease/phosphatase family metal-dependent hydrolase
MRAVIVSSLFLAMGSGMSVIGAHAFDEERDARVVRVMTRNVYHGVDAEIFAIPGATSGLELLTRVAAVYNGYLARDFPARAAALATEIAATRPDLIGLQEAVLVRTQSPADGATTAATTVAFDYVQLLLDALAARGLSYEVVAQSAGFDAELPSALGIDVRHMDREVILARADAKTSELKLSNAQAGNFAVNCTIPSRFGSFVIRRGWVAVDAKVRGRSFRFVSTHLDGDCLPVTSGIQQAQAVELVAGPVSTELPIVLVGDLNSPPDGGGVGYNVFTSAGFSDAWSLGGVGQGLSCCQDDDLLNAVSKLTSRIDFVLFRGDFTVRRATIVGDNPAARTGSGLWPSDHAGFVVEVAIPK